MATILTDARLNGEPIDANDFWYGDMIVTPCCRSQPTREDWWCTGLLIVECRCGSYATANHDESKGE